MSMGNSVRNHPSSPAMAAQAVHDVQYHLVAQRRECAYFGDESFDKKMAAGQLVIEPKARFFIAMLMKGLP